MNVAGTIAPPAYPSGVTLQSARFAFGSAPSTFGEIIQGREAASGDDFLVTLPITLRSVAYFMGFQSSAQIYISPRTKTKSRKAARLLLDHFGRSQGGVLHINSSVAEGKGLASSSADIVATLRAVAAYLEQELTTETALSIIRKIEPTDGVMYEEAVAFYHRKVELKSLIGPLPPICILAIDEGGTLDTLSYNAAPHTYCVADVEAYSTMLNDLVLAIKAGNVAQIGRLATSSARLNQHRNPKRFLQTLEACAAEFGAAGLVNCHSGTLIGLCFDTMSANSIDHINKAERYLKQTLDVSTQRFFTW